MEALRCQLGNGIPGLVQSHLLWGDSPRLSTCRQPRPGLGRGSWHRSGPTPVFSDSGLSRLDYGIRDSLRWNCLTNAANLFGFGAVMRAFSFEELELLFEQGAAIVEADRRPSSREPDRRDHVRVLELACRDKIPPRENHPAAESPIRPVARAAVPVLTVLDDGSLDAGEEIRIRRQVFTIGRSEGDLVLPNDPTLSSRHAEIRLVAHRGLSAWMLHDQGSTNRTFVRVNTARLYPDSVVILGGRWYRLRKGTAAVVFSRPTAPAEATCPVAIDRPALPMADALVEITSSSPGTVLQLLGHRETLGREPLQTSLTVDDPGLAAVHAELVAEPDGSWRIIAKPTRNGVWVSTQSKRLTACCYFQCGEQRFRFVLP